MQASGLRFLGAGVLALVALAVAVGASPVSLTVEHDFTTHPQLAFDGHPSATIEVAKRGMRTVRVVDVSPPGRQVELVLPIPLERDRLKAEELGRANGWVPTAGLDRMDSAGPGSELELSGYFEDLDLPFVGDVTAGVVRVESEGFSSTFDLELPSMDFKVLKIPSKRRLTLREFSLFECPRSLHLSGLSPGTEVTLRVAQGTTLFSSVVDGPELDLPTPGRLGLARAVLEHQGPLVRVVAISAAMLATAWLIGWLVLSSLGLARASARGRLAAIVTGGSALALVANSLAYLVGSDATAPWVRLLLVLAIGLAIFLRRRESAAAAPEDELPADVVLVSAAGVVATFWPILIGGVGALGMLRTDSFYYTTVSEVIGEHSLLSYPGNIIGHGLRSIDVALGAHIASVLGVTSNETWLALPAAALFVTPLLVFFVVKDWVGHVNVARLAAAYFAVFPSLSGLFVEVYLSQFLLTPALIGALFVAGPLFQQARAGTLRAGSATPLALTLAVSLLLYPYFALTAALTVPALWFVIAGSTRERVKWTGWLGTQVLLASNVGLWFLGNQASATDATPRLNEIAKWVVFPFADEPRFAAFFLGLVPFHADLPLLDGVIDEYVNAPVLEGWMEAVGALYVSPLTRWLAGGIVAVFVATVASSFKLLTRSPTGSLLLLSVPLLVLVAIGVRQTSGLYGYCKLMWTMSTLWPLVAMPPLGLAMLGLGRAGGLGRGVRVAAGTTVLLLFGGAVASKLFGSVAWLGHEHGVAKNSGLAGDLQRVDEWRKTIAPEARRFAFITPDRAPLVQERRVLTGHVYSILETSGWECVNAGMSADALIWMGPVEPSEEPKIVISIGAIRVPGPGWREVVHGDLLSVLERTSPE